MDARRSDADSALTPATRRRLSRRSSYRTLNTTKRTFLNSGVLATLRTSTVRRRPNVQQIENDIDPDQLALLVKDKWDLSHITPLYNFKYTEFKTYAKSLSAFLLEDKQQGTAAVAGSDKAFSVTFFTIAGVAKTKEDSETVFIQINSKPVFAAAGDPPKVVWKGWLTSVCAASQFVQLLPPEFVYLPVLCSSGSENLTFLVKSWFERTFDCCFGALSLSPMDLQWLAALWTSYHSNRKIKALKLKWTLPCSPPMDVTMTVDGQAACDLWDRTQKQQDINNVCVEDVKEFLGCIETHFYRHFKLPLSAGMLTRVATEAASVHSDGKLKICPEYLHSTVELLTECAVLRMPSV